MSASTAADDPSRAPAAPRFPRLVGTRTITVVVLLVGLELCLRHFAGLGWWTVNERNERYGWSMLPSQEARSRDLSVAEHINAMGFRDREWPAPASDGHGGWAKDESLFRVAVVGNSMTFGTSVPEADVYTRVLEQRLAGRLAQSGSPRRAMVMNFAVQGYGFEQMARVYEDRIRPYRPDVLVVALHPHDVLPMAPSVDDPDYDLRRWVMRTATYDLLLKHVIDRWIPPPPPSREARRAAQEWAALDASLTEAPFSPDNRRWFSLAGERMDVVRAQVEHDGGRLAIVLMPRWLKYFNAKMAPHDTFWGAWIRERQPSVLKVGLEPEFEQLMQPVIAELRAKGLAEGTTHDLSTLRWKDEQGREHPGTELQAASLSLNLLNDLGHLTARGHGVVAEDLARAIADAGLLK
ncbi:MAG TPA: hypothetical protein VK824_04380 [Planctomycetota bacterium]|nr:hypothetical protein [Planctomycetota bacterium]